MDVKTYTKKNTVNEITFNQFEEKLENDDTFILIIGKENCPYCNELISMLRETDKNINYNMFYLKYSDEIKEQFFLNINKYYKDINYIPYYALVVNGKTLRTNQKYLKESDFWDFLEN